jgi:hypothetical protein
VKTPAVMLAPWTWAAATKQEDDSRALWSDGASSGMVVSFGASSRAAKDLVMWYAWCRRMTDWYLYPPHIRYKKVKRLEKCQRRLAGSMDHVRVGDSTKAL